MFLGLVLALVEMTFFFKMTTTTNQDWLSDHYGFYSFDVFINSASSIDPSADPCFLHCDFMVQGTRVCGQKTSLLGFLFYWLICSNCIV